MKALALNCTLKRSPDESNTAALAQVVLDALSANDVETEMAIAGQGWTYGNKGPGPGDEEYLSSDETEWSNTTARRRRRTCSPSPRRSPLT